MISHELFARRLPWPVDWSQLYGRQAPLLLEIGFGGGHFLAELARRRPSANVLGIEIALPGIRRALQKLRHAQLDNGRVLQSAAETALWLFFAPHSIAEVYINFPDPWPKAGQQHNRLINPSFLTLLASRLAPNGRLAIATDIADYAHAIGDCLQTSPYYHNTYPTLYSHQNNDWPPTKYEQIAIDHGRLCHYFHWQRNQQPADTFPPPQEHPMPHLILQSPLSLKEIKTHFAPLQFSFDDLHIRLPMLFESVNESLLLAEVYIHEEPMPQRIGLQIRHRSDGDYLLGLSEMGFPRPTTGVHLALKCLAEWLIGLHPDTAVKHHNLITPPNSTA